MIYAYCRVSTPHQRLERQITNITELYPKAIIFREFYTGTTQNRPNWERLMTQIKKEDTIVFDSVSRMSRNADEGFKDYKMLYESGVNLIFLNEPLINTSVFDSTKNNLLNINIETGNTAVDDFFKGNVQLINNFMMALAEQQIKAAFEQSEKEVTDLHSRISQGMREAKKNGTKIGLPKGSAKDICGSYDSDKKVLNILKFNMPEGDVDYVNGQWGPQEDPFSGDVINSYNDGPTETGFVQGPFYEIETSSPAAALAPGESLTHTQYTIHIEGDEKILAEIARAVFNADLDKISNMFNK